MDPYSRLGVNVNIYIVDHLLLNVLTTGSWPFSYDIALLCFFLLNCHDDGEKF
jgi:hypothetical protein